MEWYLNKNKYEALVIGAGPGGYVAAIKLAQKGLRVSLVEKEHLGGICLNFGCIPTKSLLKSSESYRELSYHLNSSLFSEDINSQHSLCSFQKDILNSKFTNIMGKDLLQPNMENIINKSINISNNLREGINGLLKKHKVDIYSGHAKILSRKKVAISSNDNNIQDKLPLILETNNIIIATGARAREIEGLNYDNQYILNYKQALRYKKLPRKVVIVGSGAIGVEMASFYNNLGSKVYLIEAKDRIIPLEDREVSKMAHSIFTNKNINIYTSAKINHTKIISANSSSRSAGSNLKDTSKILIEFSDAQNKKQEILSDIIIVAVGIVPNIENIGIEKVGIEIEKGYIKTNDYNQTNIENIYAIGDVTSPPWLAHKASFEAMVIANKIGEKFLKSKKGEFSTQPDEKMIDVLLDRKRIKASKDFIPSCIYSSPEIASVGFTEEEAISLYGGIDNLKIGKFPLFANSKSLIISQNIDEQGFVKLIFHKKTGQLLGAHMIGFQVTELIHSISMMHQMEGTDIDIINSIFPHPTISESLHEAALVANNKPLHI
ncbi:MAG TPA: dihydrolipoyl dehydrogenase [Candidatus Megaira endosymbiont of Hartmannula sinica]|nr:dihydrolipoyl dehydrogenase [Candidatus Megaera endosymbiont of Hartmannula sinica]